MFREDLYGIGDLNSYAQIMKLDILLPVFLLVAWTVPAVSWLARHPSRQPPVIEHSTSKPLAPVGIRLHERLVASLGRSVGARMALRLLLIGSLLAVLGVGWILGTIVQDLLGHSQSPLVDGPVQQFFASHRESRLTAAMRLVTYLGDSSKLMKLALLIGLLWWWRIRNPGPLVLLTGAYIGARVIETTVKVLTHRPRPPGEQALDAFTRFAFPSAHVTYATVIYGALALLLVASSPGRRRRTLILTAAMFIVALVGLSRMYLGAHWLTDVLGGMILGVAWLWCLVAVPRTVRAATVQIESRRNSMF
jgi:membrane-associated phospholipid phosphatase